ncbi:carbon-nitrogen hydrolase family protein [Olleya sp. 1-3]|uniref:carbon-nitrogen hydrolase family protein n=1 Tax=Olleya sp. 1-3 TaxID=2058323 RepID=UPI0018E296E4|nr:carbon-nitrogen hydrolase family protein [Olleya sp. 1-3]
MKIASAQIKSTIGEINQNLETHYKMIDLASKNGVNLIIFPEMSITGYCREKARELSMTEFDKKLNTLKKNAVEKNITIVVGAPIKIDNKMHIGSFIFLPNNLIKIYTKQYLHDGEERYFEPSFENNPIIEINEERFSFAICADIENELHPKKSCELNNTFYLPSIFYSKNGIDSGIEKLKNYAKKYSLNILMSNFNGEHWNIEAGGKSCFINNKGELKSKLTTNEDGLLIIHRKNNNWESEIITIK